MLQKDDWYSRPEFLNAQRMQYCWQRWQTVTQREINPRVVQCEHKTHLLTRRQATKGDCGAFLAVVYTLGYQMITLQRNTEDCNQARLFIEKHRTLPSVEHSTAKYRIWLSVFAMQRNSEYYCEEMAIQKNWEHCAQSINTEKERALWSGRQPAERRRN
jgi:hypothetical protein